MNQALSIGKTGLDAQQKRMAVISNNLANVSTTGFKRDSVAFEDLLYQTQRQAGGASSEQTNLPTGLSIGTGSRVSATAKQFTQGNLTPTGNALDVAINGRGFFEVLLPDGTSAYSRDGSFKTSPEGELVTNEGYPIVPGIQVPEGAETITIATDGTISAKVDGQDEVQIGQLTLTDFTNPAGLQALGENLYGETIASGPPRGGTPGTNGIGRLVQGSLEASNVNMAEELVAMIEAQRAYETSAKAISTADQMLGFLNNNL